MRPVVNGLKQKYSSQVRFGDLDFDDKSNKSLIDKYRIVGHPSFVIIDGTGNLVKRWIGIVTAGDLESVLAEVIKH
jgi:thioredoxin-related protein